MADEKDPQASELHTLLARAYQLLDENKYSEACDLYREAALLAPPTQGTLTNLSIARDLEWLEFIRLLKRKYPGSLVVRKREIHELMQGGAIAGSASLGSAIAACTQLLEADGTPFGDKLHLRWRRLRAATLVMSSPGEELSDTLIEDFIILWKVGDTHEWAIRSRRELLREVAGVKEPKAVPTILSLASRDEVPPHVKDFLYAKARELEVLEQIDKDLTARPR